MQYNAAHVARSEGEAVDERPFSWRTRRLGVLLSAVFLLFSLICASVSLTACAAGEGEAGSQAAESEVAVGDDGAADNNEADGDDVASEEAADADDAAEDDGAADADHAADVDDAAASEGGIGDDEAGEDGESDASGGVGAEQSSYGEAGVDFVADEIIIVYEGEALELDEALGFADDEGATLLSLGVTSQEMISTSEGGGATVLAQLDGKASVEELVELLPQASAIAAAQPNYLYSLQ